MIKNFLVIMSMALAVGGLTALQPAAAFDPYGGVKCSGKNDQSAVCKSPTPTNDPLSGNNGILINVADIVAFVAGAAAIIIILMGSIKYITSAGGANNATAARNMVLYALIGLAVVVRARSIINFVITRI